MRFYGIDRERIGSAVSVYTAAACVSLLPKESALAARLRPEETVSYQEILLNVIASRLCGRAIPFPWQEFKRDSGLPDIKTSTVDEFDDWYNNTQFGGERWQEEVR